MRQIALSFSLGISLLTGSAMNAIPSIAIQPSFQSNAHLTSKQILQLRSTNVPIVVPQYVPAGFRVVDVSVDTRDRRFGPHYSINYKNAEDVCFSVMFTGGGVGGESYDYRLPIQTKLLGELSLTFGSQVARSAKRPSQSELNSRYPVLLTDWAQLPGTQRGYYSLQSEMAGAGEKAGCKTITPREAVRIAQSLTLLGERQTAANNKSAPTLARITFRTLYSDSAFGEFHQFKQSSQADASGIQFAASKQQSRQSLEEVEKTVRNLTDRYRQWVKDSENNSVSSGYLRDRRKPEQRAMLQNFITAWSSPEPVAAPFFGSWKGYESEITIYPSKHVSRVCVISTGEGTGRFDVGQVKRSTIHYQNRLLFRDNKYLGVFAALNGKLSLANDEVPYNNPNPLEEVSTFISRRVLDPSSRASIIKQFEQQDCITSLPQTLSSAATNTAEERSSLVKATVFNSVINQFRRTLTSDKALRLPLKVPAIYNKGVASIDGDRYVRIGRQAHCSSSCEYLTVSTNEPTQENLEWFRNHRENDAEAVDLAGGIVGFYDVNKDGSRSGAKNVMWQQDNKIMYLSMRLNSSRNEVIETARTMASSQARISASPANTVANSSTSINPTTQLRPWQNSQIAQKQPPVLAKPISFQMCQVFSDWRRPTETEQRAKLDSMPNYRGTFEALREYTKNDLVLRLSYGLATTENLVYSTGLWKASVNNLLDHCYRSHQVQQINSGRLAEIWLFNNQLQKLAWDGKQYIASVANSGQGVQIIQFARQNTVQPVTLKVVNRAGMVLEAITTTSNITAGLPSKIQPSRGQTEQLQQAQSKSDRENLKKCSKDQSCLIAGALIVEEYTETYKDGKNSSTLKVYNPTASAALVEVYDKTGQLKNIETIESMENSATNLGNIVVDGATKIGRVFQYGLGVLASKKYAARYSEVRFDWEAGDSIRISRSSDYVLMYNTLAATADSAILLPDILKVKTGTDTKTLQKFVKEFVLDWAKGSFSNTAQESALNLFKDSNSFLSLLRQGKSFQEAIQGKGELGFFLLTGKNYLAKNSGEVAGEIFKSTASDLVSGLGGTANPAGAILLEGEYKVFKIDNIINRLQSSSDAHNNSEDAVLEMR